MVISTGLFNYQITGHKKEKLTKKDKYVRSEVLMAVRMTLFFWVVMPCSLVGRHQRFGENTVSVFRAEDGDSVTSRSDEEGSKHL
jgi:hypothetical protein